MSKNKDLYVKIINGKVVYVPKPKKSKAKKTADRIVDRDRIEDR